ncbi:hypothetical protein [Haloechinothrix salitolerans]|uniref:Uncharacterized protein n=1 Tax=Haloechinothrix salitolerans TaxID=926830 RepID=A0ABW2C0K5_9PSEU
MLVEARVLGRSHAVVEPHEFAYEPRQPVTLRQLIADVVRGEVGSELDPERLRRFLRVLAAEHIDNQRETPVNGSRCGQIDVDEVVRAAIDGFEHGFYYVFIGDQQYENLDQPVPIEAGTRVRFVRLVPLED